MQMFQASFVSQFSNDTWIQRKHQQMLIKMLIIMSFLARIWLAVFRHLIDRSIRTSA